MFPKPLSSTYFYFRLFAIKRIKMYAIMFVLRITCIWWIQHYVQSDWQWEFVTRRSGQGVLETNKTLWLRLFLRMYVFYDRTIRQFSSRIWRICWYIVCSKFQKYQHFPYAVNFVIKLATSLWSELQMNSVRLLSINSVTIA